MKPDPIAKPGLSISDVATGIFPRGTSGGRVGVMSQIDYREIKDKTKATRTYPGSAGVNMKNSERKNTKVKFRCEGNFWGRKAVWSVIRTGETANPCNRLACRGATKAGQTRYLPNDLFVTGLGTNPGGSNIPEFEGRARGWSGMYYIFQLQIQINIIFVFKAGALEKQQLVG